MNNCSNCFNSWGWNATHVTCHVGTLVSGKVVERLDRNYTDEEIGIHFELDPMIIERPQDCRFWREIVQYTHVKPHNQFKRRKLKVR